MVFNSIVSIILILIINKFIIFVGLYYNTLDMLLYFYNG